MKKKKQKRKVAISSASVPSQHTFTSYQRLLMQLAARKSATSAAIAATAASNLVEAAESRSGTPQRAFIPNSTKQNAKEFNVVATVSKATREATRLNASFASKIKSLDDAEVEKTLFHNVRRVGLADMLEHLSSVKHLQSSSSSYY